MVLVMAMRAGLEGCVWRIRRRKVAVLREHPAREIPIAGTIHRNRGRAATSLARLADQVATLHLIDVVVIRVPVILMLAVATIKDGQGRA